MSNSTEITKVQVIIRRFLWETREVVNDSESSRRWLENFRNTLQFQDLNDNPEPYALALLSEARKFNEQQLRKQQTRWVRESLKKDGITNPTKEQIETRWAELYGNETSVEDGARESQGRTGGGSVRGSQRIEPPARSLTLPTTEQLYDFARAENLDEADARDWYEMTVVERAGKDRYGKPIGNWKVTCRRFCEAKAKKRSTQK